MMNIRPPAVSGLFYADSAVALQQQIDGFLDQQATALSHPLKALVVPHAGYIYSGAVAGKAYQLLRSEADRIRRVVLLGPSHRYPLKGMALPSVDAFHTPLGDVPIDRQVCRLLDGQPQLKVLDEAHELEHSLEVQLPFLQQALGGFTLVPVVVGWCAASDVAAMLECVWGGEETLIVISSDLSHYHHYQDALKIDQHTARRIEALDECIEGEEACGCYALNGLMAIARRKELDITRVALCNSGDTAGDKSRVVGYGAWALG